MLHRYGSIYTGLIGSLRFQVFEIKGGDEGHYQRILVDVLGYSDIHRKNWDTLRRRWQRWQGSTNFKGSS